MEEWKETIILELWLKKYSSNDQLAAVSYGWINQKE